jgi:hypothetical protein
MTKAIGTILDLSRHPDMPSVVTLRALIARHPDFPLLERGKRGRGYRIDLEAAAQFVASLKGPKPISPVERRELIRALGLEFALRDHGGIENVDCSE